MIPTFGEICERVGKHPKMVHGCYIFGSQVYGTADNHSDWDIMLIANSSVPELEHNDGRFNIHTVTPDKFKEWCYVNHIKAIECMFAQPQFQLKPFDYEFKFKEASFRHNISHTVSNSWVKSKKKLMQSDYYIGVKSLFHSLRIANFGIQFAKTGKIEFSEMNWLWKELMEREWNWLELEAKYKPLRNNLMSEFRTLCEKIEK